MPAHMWSVCHESCNHRSWRNQNKSELLFFSAGSLMFSKTLQKKKEKRNKNGEEIYAQQYINSKNAGNKVFIRI